MPRTPMIFGISMVSQKRRRWLVVFCYAALWALILLGLASKSFAIRYILLILATWVGTWIQCVIFYSLAKDTVLPLQADVNPISLGLLRKAFSNKSKPDERQVAVRNAAYYKAYRIVAAYCLLMPIVFLYLIALNKIMLLGIYLFLNFTMIYTLPQAVILWTEPDIPEEAI
jgi:hypothetical protein